MNIVLFETYCVLNVGACMCPLGCLTGGRKRGDFFAYANTNSHDFILHLLPGFYQHESLSLRDPPATITATPAPRRNGELINT